MKKFKVTEAKTYSAPGHFGMAAMRLSGKEETGAQKFWMGFSHFLPGGGAEYAYEKDSPAEKLYFVLSGEVTIKTKKEVFKLGPYEGIFIGPNEGREIKNETNFPASMLVIVNY